MNINQIKNLTYAFRIALDSIVADKQFGRLHIFHSFPRGCCTYTSDLLAEYLIDNGIPRNQICSVSGESISQQYAHCWLCINNSLYVDVTADQFNYTSYFKDYQPIPNCYLVSCDSPSLYDLFDKNLTKYSYRVGIDSYSYDTSNKLRFIYNAIINRIDTDTQGGSHRGLL